MALKHTTTAVLVLLKVCCPCTVGVPSLLGVLCCVHLLSDSLLTVEERLQDASEYHLFSHSPKGNRKQARSAAARRLEDKCGRPQDYRVRSKKSMYPPSDFAPVLSYV
jgi:hypothetical protein